MRLDLFLKKTSLIRHRTLAKDLCVAGAVSVDGRVAKASHEVRPGETIVVRTATRILEARIVEIPRGNVSRRDAGRYVELMHEEHIDPVERVFGVQEGDDLDAEDEAERS